MIQTVLTRKIKSIKDGSLNVTSQLKVPLPGTLTFYD